MRTLPAERLAALLADAAAPIPLVVVGGRTHRPDGLAQELVRHGVGRVLATQDELGGPYALVVDGHDPGLLRGAGGRSRVVRGRRRWPRRDRRSSRGIRTTEHDHHGAPLVRSYWTTVHTLFAATDDPPLRGGAAAA